MESKFNQRKKAVLSKLDKSSIGEWDKKIKFLCENLNNSNDYYTTSSCSGRVVLMIDQEKKERGLFLNVSHDLISLDFFKDLNKINTLRVYPESFPKKMITKDIKFKCEPPLLHIACKDLESASYLLEEAKKIGWKRSGIITFGKNIILELHSTDKLEFPIISNGIFLVDDNFLKIIVKQSNEKLKKGWKKIEKLQKIKFL